MSGRTALRERAERLDAADPLAPARDEFAVPDPSLAYLDGNSLGMMPLAALDRMREVAEQQWAGGLIRSWEHWLDLPSRVGDALAPLIGARPGEVVVHDSVTVGLYQLVRAAIALRPDRRVIAVDAGEFPTDRYVVEGIAADAGYEVRHATDRLDDVAVVVRSHVDYRTAEVADMAAETARADAAGAVTVWDVSHSVGVLPVDLHDAGAALAVGCTYKFLNGGPGAPAFTFVSSDVVADVRSPLQGWFGHRDQFAMGPGFEPHADARRLLLGTPDVLALNIAAVGIELTARFGIAAISAKATALTSFALECCAAAGLESPTPADDARRGGHVSVRHPDARTLVERLAGERNVIADFRTPDLIRLGCSPLTTRFVDVHTAVVAIAELSGR